jgi:hypothetical protein
MWIESTVRVPKQGAGPRRFDRLIGLTQAEDLGDKIRDVLACCSLSVGGPVQKFIHSIGGLSSELWQNVGIGVHGHADLGTAGDSGAPSMTGQSMLAGPECADFWLSSARPTVIRH